MLTLRNLRIFSITLTRHKNSIFNENGLRDRVRNYYYLSKCQSLLRCINFYQNKVHKSQSSHFFENCEPKPLGPLLNTNENEKESIIENHELEQIKSLFSQPKAVLNNIFQVVSKELKNKDLLAVPHYTHSRKKGGTGFWTCTLNLKWPTEEKFVHTARSKQTAFNVTALNALAWLKKLKKINDYGQPYLYDKNEVKKLKKKEVFLDLNEESVVQLSEIVNLYRSKLYPALEKISSDQNDVDVEAKQLSNELEDFWPSHRSQSVADVMKYMAKESVILPIFNYREKIKDLVKKNRILVIKGEPGCGKSTRVPQYILEAWAENGMNDNCRIIVTEPRRIAATSLADRVAREREEKVGSIVGYQVRLQSKFNYSTGKILYCTTGILLRRLQSDPKLTDCTHIVLDEAHERDVNVDLLMTLLKTTLNLNPELKLLVMSATIDTDVFQNYFKDAAVLHIPGFTYPVQVHFLEDIKNVDLSQTNKMCSDNFPNVVTEDVVKVIMHIHKTQIQGAILCFLPGWEDITKVKKSLPHLDNIHILCLHSRMEDKEQHKIFSSPPPGFRKIILATNIAETSVTIDDVVHVVDTGIHKEKRFDAEKGVMCIDNHWISKASMKQRKGRAGRLREGISYHLYPKTKYESFPDYTVPEILIASLTKIVLDTKVYSNNMNAVEFFQQLPCPPPLENISKAVDELVDLEMLDENENLTPLGRALSNFQLEPKLSKAMVNAVVFKCVTPIVDIVTLFSAETELFAKGLIDKQCVKNTKQYYSNSSDHLSMMRIFEKWLEYVDEQKYDEAHEFCFDHKILYYKLNTMKKLRQIHFEYLYKGLKDVMRISNDYSDNDEMIKAVLLSGVGNHLFRRHWDILKGQLKKSNVLITRNNQKALIGSESVNHKRDSYPSDFLVYINETRSNIRRATMIRESSFISPLSVLLFKNNELYIKKVNDDDSADQVTNDNLVKLKMAKSTIELICDREQALLLMECKKALQSGLEYYTFQLTDGGNIIPEVNEYWDSILKLLDGVLKANANSND